MTTKNRPLLISALVLSILLALPAFSFLQASRQIDKQKAIELMRRNVERLVRKSPRLAGTTMAVYMPEKGIDSEFGASHRLFHTASVGKLFTSVMIVRKIESGAIRAESRICELVPEQTLAGLFVFEGKDYANEVSVEQLLAHSSGIADYFDGDTFDGTKKVSKLMIDEPDREWTPALLLEHSRLHQHAVAKPGERYHYSDSGYILLGLAIEALYGRPFEQAVADEILIPLGMNDSYMPWRSQPVNKPAMELPPSWLNGHDLSRARSMSADHAGGGFATTTKDLMLFGRAILDGRLISRKSLEWMSEDLNVFGRGMHYGRGMMRLKMGEFFPLLASYPEMIGHMGILGTQFFFDVDSGSIIVISLCDSGHMPDSVRLLISALGTGMRVK